MEQYQGIRADGPGRLIRYVCEKVFKKLRMDGVNGVRSMTSMIECVADHPEFACIRVTILSAWRVKAP